MKEKRQICKKWLFVIVATAILFALIATIDYLNIPSVKGININDTVNIYGYAVGIVDNSKSGGKPSELSFVGKLVEKQ